MTVGKGQDFSFSIEASDSETLSYRLDDRAPEWITINENTGLLSVDSALSVEGEYIFDVIVSDGINTVTRTIKLNVVSEGDASNSLPVIASIPTLTARTHYPLNYEVKASDANGDVVTFLLLNQPDWVSINPETGVLTALASSGDERPEPYKFKVQVSDGKGTVEKSIDLIVTFAEAPEVPEFDNSLPSIDNLPIIRMKATESTTHRVLASDADGNKLTFSLQNQPNWISIDAYTGLIKFSPAKTDVGTHQVNVIVSDGFIDIAKTLQVVVSAVDEEIKPQHAPLVEEIPAISAKIGQTVTHRIRAYDEDGDALSFEIENSPRWLTVDHNIGLITVSPDNRSYIGSHNFELLVSDGFTTVKRPIQIEILESDAPVVPENTPPVIAAIADKTVMAEHTSSQRVAATDADGDTLTYSMETPKSWASINPRSGMMTFEPTLIDVGTHTLTVKVSDGKAEVGRSFTLNVNRPAVVPDDNRAPIIEPIERINALAGRMATYRVRANDLDGDSLTYALADAPTWVTIDAEGIMDIAPSVDVEGDFTFNVVVSDGKLQAKSAVTIHVTALETPVPVNYNASLVISGKKIIGDVQCNGDDLADGVFKADETEFVNCQFGAVQLGDLDPQKYEGSGERPETTVATYDLGKHFGEATENATKVLQSISTCTSLEQICLDEFDSLDIQAVFNQLEDDTAVNVYLGSKAEEATDEIGKAPSSHIDTEQAPVVTPGASNNIANSNNEFVSASAEDSLAYQPTLEAQVLTKSILTDANGIPLSGIEYFAGNARGTTNAQGEFEHRWGDTITFGIDTFTFGRVKGNQMSYKLTDVTDNQLQKDNIQALLERYAVISENEVSIGEDVRETFAQFPNVINEIINLSLPNGGKLEGTEFFLPNEFEQQFNQGLAQVIDQSLNKHNFIVKMPQTYSSPSDETYVTDSLNEIFNSVSSFHIFNDNYGYYGASGNTRGMRTLNMSNRAFPVMMPRTDINRLIPFGDQQAWTRDGKPYIAQHESIEMPAIPLVTSDTATYGFPFVTAGEIGKGKVVFMGNSMYPSILSCPDNYWANSHNELRPNGETQVCHSNVTKADARYDNGDMKRFFSNLFDWFSTTPNKAVGTNIVHGMVQVANVPEGYQYPFFINTAYGLGPVTQLSSGSYDSLDPKTMPILVMQAFKINQGYANNTADVTRPTLTNDDVTALIRYVNAGGNILFMDAVNEVNPEPIGRLADAAGVSLGGQNVTPTDDSHCDPGNKYCNRNPDTNTKQTLPIVTLQMFEDMAGGEPPFSVQPDGSVDWVPPADMPKFVIPKYEVTEADGNKFETSALIRVNNESERDAAIQELQAAFPGVPVCNSEYEYEFNCIETRTGTGIFERSYGRADFARYSVDVESMVKASNIGGNVQKLLDHEVYYRTKGKQGARLSTVELNQTYDNLSVWLWNDNQYAYDPTVQDELGFETLVSYLNCYTNDAHGSGKSCPESYRTMLVANGMLNANGELNPSYPLNYMEKPLTRIMLGRSFWDFDIKVDTTKYPTRPTGSTTSASVDIVTQGNAVTFSAGNMQSTGLWAKQLEDVTVTGGVPATITVMLADDLTGRPQHETNLNRPPRMQMTFNHDGISTVLKVPYGGLIYVQPHSSLGETATFNFSNVVKAPLYKNGAWVTSPSETDVQIAEVDTGSFIYTTPVNNVKGADLAKFTADMNRFADAASDFYGRDETTAEGAHRRFTYDDLIGFRHRYVNDVQISIGAAHSGYPIMASGFNANGTLIPTNAVDDWLLWHEAGHNFAVAPFAITGSTEVTNNVLALYMQELEGRNDNPEMDRIRIDIQKAPAWLAANEGHAWSQGDAGIRLVMFGQFKIWAETHFDIDNWYAEGDEKPSVYGKDQGWNLFKLMHRKTRGDVQGDTGLNHCSSSVTGFGDADQLMICASYASGYDLTDFFTKWNPGETSFTTPEGEKVYMGGISTAAKAYVASLDLPVATNNPVLVNALPKPITR